MKHTRRICESTFSRRKGFFHFHYISFSGFIKRMHDLPNLVNFLDFL